MEDDQTEELSDGTLVRGDDHSYDALEVKELFEHDKSWQRSWCDMDKQEYVEVIDELKEPDYSNTTDENENDAEVEDLFEHDKSWQRSWCDMEDCLGLWLKIRRRF